jgi:hypothetical protein
VITEIIRVGHGRIDAHIGRKSGDSYIFDAARAQDLVQSGASKRGSLDARR